ncbi:Ig-like domain-containing protein [Rhodococcus sp. Z13]|uniref:Ig-like domain-containing protein n=1 Tax=Rhodococcus sacchari TaxID=2962047 RepID=A0ACD4DK14_9NOCA|nr:Ig-like domain-containing protein [Rhodococcus sp. Z13]UYP20393.1 Ig-like domain-containing protein [Rhodococcus sp. Z13]
MIVIGVVAFVTGCTGASGTGADEVPIDSNPVAALIKPTVSSSVSDGSVGFSPIDPVTVSVVNGKLDSVTLLNPAGEPVAGELSPDGLTWANTEPLGYNRSYTLETVAYGLGGATTSVASFTTSSPANLTQPYVLPGEGSVVGIGQPVAVQFDENIPDRLAAEQAITVTTNPPVEGAFYWVSNREVRWRPENYWAPGTTVNVEVKVYGKDLGEGLFGQADVTSSFTIGDAVIITADDNTKQVTVNRNGVDVMTMPTSFGKDSSPTPNGVYIIGDRFANMIMDSSTYGVPADSPQGYRTPVDWAVRMSYSGIFFHSAPWSIGDQGVRNVSHGCLNLSPANAKWIYDNTKRGDIVIVRNTVGGTLPGTEGLGDWNIPWSTWKAGNAAA